MFPPPAFLMKVPVLRRLVPSILRRYARVFKHRYSIESRMGALFLIDQRNAIDRNLMIKGAWEPAQVAKLQELLHKTKLAQEKAVFLDIGAHGALYSILMKTTGAFDRIIAFEPEPVNLAQLRANLLLNDMLGKIEVIEMAASKCRGKIPFFIAQERGGSRMTDAEWENPVVLEGRIEVDAAPVDDLVEFSGGLVVAKVDVEGSEMAVLAGMTRTIANNRCLFQIESFDSKFSELRGWLSERDFEYVAKCGFDHFFIKTVLRAPPERHC